jgi:hypothetical protein
MSDPGPAKSVPSSRMQSRATHMLRVLLLLLRCWLQPSRLGLPGAKLWRGSCRACPHHALAGVAAAAAVASRLALLAASCAPASAVVRVAVTHCCRPPTLITYPIHARIAGRRPPCMGGGGGVECALSLCQSECFCWITFVLGPHNDKTDPSLGGLNLSHGWAATTVFVHGPLN